jgi:GxxExxY protein
MSADEVAKDIVDAALKVHRALGPRLLESAYQACLAQDLERRRHCVECEVGVPLEFEGAFIEVGYRIDRRIDQLVLVENKTVEKILPSDAEISHRLARRQRSFTLSCCRYPELAADGYESVSR